jgi:uncharacterized membrane protein
MSIFPPIIFQSLILLAAALLLLYLPGYALSLVLFLPGTLDRLERGFIAILASILLSSLSAAAFLLIAGQLDSFIFTVSLLGIVVVASALAYVRLRRSTVPEINTTADQHAAKPQRLTLRLAGTILLSVAALIIVLFAGDANRLASDETAVADGITEFYIAPQQVEAVLESIQNGEEHLVIPLVIRNNADEVLQYRVEIAADGQEVWGQAGIQVVGHGTWTQTVPIHVDQVIPGVPLDIGLYVHRSADWIASLRIWLHEDGQ